MLKNLTKGYRLPYICSMTFQNKKYCKNFHNLFGMSWSFFVELNGVSATAEAPIFIYIKDKTYPLSSRFTHPTPHKKNRIKEENGRMMQLEENQIQAMFPRNLVGMLRKKILKTSTLALWGRCKPRLFWKFCNFFSFSNIYLSIVIL
jgi:hypothetical protein